MKKMVYFVTFIMICCMCLCGCSDGKNRNSDEVIVTFETNGGSIIQKQTIKKGGKIEIPLLPIKEGYIFDFWYISNDIFTVETKWDFLIHTVSSDMSLYVHWIDEKVVRLAELNKQKDSVLQSIDKHTNELAVESTYYSFYEEDYNNKNRAYSNFRVKKVRIYSNGGFIYVDDFEDVQEKKRLKEIRDKAYEEMQKSDVIVKSLKEELAILESNLDTVTLLIEELSK